MKALSLTKVIKSKHNCFQLFLNQAHTLSFCACILHARSSTQVKLHTQKIRQDEANLSRPDRELISSTFRTKNNVIKPSTYNAVANNAKYTEHI